MGKDYIDFVHAIHHRPKAEKANWVLNRADVLFKEREYLVENGEMTSMELTCQCIQIAGQEYRDKFEN